MFFRSMLTPGRKLLLLSALVAPAGRYGTNGFPDVAYGTEGTGFATLAQGAEVSVNMCKLDNQGRLLVAGSVRASSGAPLTPFLARLWN
jgi:hypothetical protein